MLNSCKTPGSEGIYNFRIVKRRALLSCVFDESKPPDSASSLSDGYGPSKRIRLGSIPDKIKTDCFVRDESPTSAEINDEPIHSKSDVFQTVANERLCKLDLLEIENRTGPTVCKESNSNIVKPI